MWPAIQELFNFNLPSNLLKQERNGEAVVKNLMKSFPTVYYTQVIQTRDIDDFRTVYMQHLNKEIQEAIMEEMKKFNLNEPQVILLNVDDHIYVYDIVKYDDYNQRMQ
jgi:hypothetical protein